jgi:phosphatidylserine decarboxylase
VAANPELKRHLIASIEQAKQINPDPLTNPAQSLEQYFEFVAWAERAIPASLLKAKPDATPYQRIDQSLAYLYFIADLPLNELEGRGYFNNTLQYAEPYSSWLKTFVRSWGAFLDTPESWNKEYLRIAQADGTFGLNRGWYEDPSHWRTFNQFFAPPQVGRTTARSPHPPNIQSWCLPSTRSPEGTWAIDNTSRVVEKSGVAVKTGTVQSVEQLIGGQSRYKAAFAGGRSPTCFSTLATTTTITFPLAVW